MKDALPTIDDVKAILYKTQRRKNVIPSHANLTHKSNLKILRTFDEIDAESDADVVADLQGELRELLQQKRVFEDEMFESLRKDLEYSVLNPLKSVRLRRRSVNGRTVTVFNKTRPKLMMFDRFVSLKLARSFDVQHNGRDQRIRVLINTLRLSAGGGIAQQGILKRDIKDFYGSIDHDILMAKLHGHAGVPRYVRNHVANILQAQARLTGRSRGIPDGIPSSSVLAEIYLERVDLAMRRLPGVALYLRYVDDVVIVSELHQMGRTMAAFAEELSKIALLENVAKTQDIEHPSDVETSFEYLGYKFNFAPETSSLMSIDISQSKRDRYLSALGRLSLHANSTTCWAQPGSVDLYISLVHYVFSPHSTKPAVHGTRIVTGLAYSAKFMAGSKSDRSLYNEVLRVGQREVNQRWGSLRKLDKSGAGPACSCCGLPIPRWLELLLLAESAATEDSSMYGAARAHVSDALRLKVNAILWS